jgi:uncharacterized protein YidB (DUF937 family)
MDIQKFLQERGQGLVQQLTTQVGLAPQTAQSFLSHLATKSVELVKKGGVDAKTLMGGGDLTALTGKLGIPQIARQIGIDEARATQGAKAVLPGLLQGLQRETGGFSGMGGTAGDYMKKAGEIFGKD